MSKIHDINRHLKGAGPRPAQGVRPPQAPQPSAIVQVDPSLIVVQKCDCGCPYFQPAVQIGFVSAIMSPTGQELVNHTQVLVCLDCRKPFVKK